MLNMYSYLPKKSRAIDPIKRLKTYFEVQGNSEKEVNFTWLFYTHVAQTFFFLKKKAFTDHVKNCRLLYKVSTITTKYVFFFLFLVKQPFKKLFFSNPFFYILSSRFTFKSFTRSKSTLRVSSRLVYWHFSWLLGSFCCRLTRTMGKSIPGKKNMNTHLHGRYIKKLMHFFLKKKEKKTRSSTNRRSLCTPCQWFIRMLRAYRLSAKHAFPRVKKKSSIQQKTSLYTDFFFLKRKFISSNWIKRQGQVHQYRINQRKNHVFVHNRAHHLLRLWLQHHRAPVPLAPPGADLRLPILAPHLQVPRLRPRIPSADHPRLGPAWSCRRIQPLWRHVERIMQQELSQRWTERYRNRQLAYHRRYTCLKLRDVWAEATGV